MNSMEQISNIFSISCQNKNSGNGDIRTDIKSFRKNGYGNDWHTWCKKIKNIKSHYLVLVKRTAVKSSSKLFGV